MTLQAYAAVTATDWERRARGAGWLLASGSLMKVDLSGFTRLSERLARSDISGAEHLNTVLNDVFVALIDQVLERGGDILQFGGDALLVWFEGESHAARSVAAGRAMQRVLAQRPAEQTPAGPVRLRMSAAVATGDLLLTVVGQDHHELLTLGPVATRMELLEKEAASGQLLIDSGTAAALRPSEVRRVGADSWLSRRAPDDVTVVRTRPSGPRAADFVAPDVRELEQSGQVTGEHRRAAAAFIGLSGLDGLLKQQGPEAVVARAREVAAAVDAAVAETRVTWTASDVMADGAVFLLFAGAPVAREDDEERLLRACRVVVERCGSAVRVGANAGRVFAADVGHPERRTFAIIGDTTNLAARLMHRAGPGEVLASAQVFEPSERDHEISWVEPFTVRNRRTPVRAGVLGPRTATGARRRTHDVPLVGREGEMSVLRGLVAAVRGEATEPLRVALSGDPGVGKSRLVEAVTKDCGEVRVLRVAPTVFDTATPYAATRKPLRALLGVQDGSDVGRLAHVVDEPELLPLLALPLGVDLPQTHASRDVAPEFREARRNALLAELVVRSSGSALLAVVEDLHWLDGASRGLVDALARLTEPGRAGILLTLRGRVATRLEDADGWTTLPLQPLGREDSRQLALQLSGDRALSDAELDRLAVDTGGNPLFLRELVSFTTTAEGELPSTAEEVITARIDALGPARRRLLRDASVGGTVQDLGALSRVLDSPPLGAASAWSDLADFVSVVEAAAGSSGGAALEFRHELYRQSAYQGLAVRRRRALHAAWADDVLDPSGAPARARAGVSAATVSAHLLGAGRMAPASEWARRAAEEARAGGALHDAVGLYESAVRAGQRARVPERELAAVQERLGDTAELAGQFDVADAALRRAARSGEPLQVARRLVARATVLERRGSYRTALAQLTRAERQLAGSASDETTARVRAAMDLRRSSVEHRVGRLRRAYSLAQQAVARAEAVPGDGLRLERARALLRLEMIASEAGWPQRFDLGREALRAFDGLDSDRDLAMLLGNIGVTLWESDDWSGARRQYEESRAAYLRAGDVLGAAIAANNVGEILCEQGDLAGAREVFEDARRVARAAARSWVVPCTASALGRVAVRTGDLDRAEALLHEAVADLDAIGSVILAADARVRQVELALVREQHDAVVAAAEMVRRLGEMEVGSVLPLTAARYHATALAGVGQLVDARSSAQDALQQAAASGVAHEESLLLDLLLSLRSMQGDEPDPASVARRDEVWSRLGIREVFRYPQIAGPAGDARR